MQPATVNRAVAKLKHLCGLAASWGWMPPEIEVAIRKVKLLKEPPGRVRYLSDDERIKLFTKLGKGLRPIVETGLLSGMRLSEIITLRKSSVDLKRCEITLTRTKNNKVRRLPINPNLLTILERAMTQSEDEHVFLNTRGKPYTMHGASGLFAKTVKRAKIDDFHFHDLRHDFATRVRRGGSGLDVVAALLGHSSLAMAQRYAHIGSAELAAAVSGLGAAQATSADVIDLKEATKDRADSARE